MMFSAFAMCRKRKMEGEEDSSLTQLLQLVYPIGRRRLRWRHKNLHRSDQWVRRLLDILEGVCRMYSGIYEENALFTRTITIPAMLRWLLLAMALCSVDGSNHENCEWQYFWKLVCLRIYSFPWVNLCWCCLQQSILGPCYHDCQPKSGSLLQPSYSYACIRL